MEELTFIVVTLFFYALILGGCLFALSIGITLYNKKQISKTKYFASSVFPILIGLVGLLIFNKI